jgi:hypothetical protein
LLQVDVLLARGQREQARMRAQGLLTRTEAARYRERLQAVLASATQEQVKGQGR